MVQFVKAKRVKWELTINSGSAQLISNQMILTLHGIDNNELHNLDLDLVKDNLGIVVQS